jgi:hypothetical protein
MGETPDVADMGASVIAGVVDFLVRNTEKAALDFAYDKIVLAAERLLSFIDAFRTLWYTENKPHGFEVQEARLGALHYRLTAVRKRLAAYLDGKEATLPELEETLLPLSLAEIKHNWGKMTTVCPI